MSSFYSNNLRVLVARKEETSGIPVTLTSADFDVRVRNPTVTATMEADDEASKYATGDHGEDVAVMGAQSASIEFSIKMSSTDGTTSPKWWKFAEACGCEIKTYENGSSAVIGKALQYCRNRSLIMSKTVYSILFLYTLSFCGWERTTQYFRFTEIGYRGLGAVFFLDTLNGWIGGKERVDLASWDHYLSFTTDGGLNWTKQFVDSSLESIWDVFFVDKNVGWLTGTSHDNKGMIVNTTDGGKTWNTVLSDSSLRSPRKILFPTPSVGYFFTYNDPVSLVGKTIDGGKNWSIKDGRLDWWGLFEDAFFINADTGFAVGEAGSSGFVNRTVDGGASWETLFPRIDGKSLPVFTSVFFLDSKRGWVGGHYWGVNPTIAYTADGGNTWEIQKDSSAGNILDIHFVNDTVGWATGLDLLYFTQNGGKNWDRVTMDTTFESVDMHFVTPNHGWIVGGNNTVYRTTDNGGHPQSVSVLPNMRNKSKSAFINIGLASVQSRGVIKVNYSMVSDGSVSISVYDLKGGKIAYLPEKIHSKGEHSFSFKASRGFYLLDIRGKSSGKEIKTVEKIFVN